MVPWRAGSRPGHPHGALDISRPTRHDDTALGPVPGPPRAARAAAGRPGHREASPIAPTTDTSPEQSPDTADRVPVRRPPATLLGAALAVAALAALAVVLLDATRSSGRDPVAAPAVAGPPEVFRDVPPLEDSVPFVPVAPLPADRSVPLSAVQVQQLMVEAGFPRSEIGTGVAIALAESERVPDAVNPDARVGADRGLWQINDHFWAPELGVVDWREPAANTRVALEVWSRQGWSAWATYDPAAMDHLRPPGPGSLPR